VQVAVPHGCFYCGAAMRSASTHSHGQISRYDLRAGWRRSFAFFGNSVCKKIHRGLSAAAGSLALPRLHGRQGGRQRIRIGKLARNLSLA